MISGVDFILSNSELIEKEKDLILQFISESIENTGGYVQGSWSLDYAPQGTIHIVAEKLEESLSTNGWFCRTDVEINRSMISFVVYPKSL